MSSVKKTFFIILSLLILSVPVLLTGCGAPSQAAASDSADTVQSTKIIPSPAISAGIITDVSQPDEDGYYSCDYNGVERKYILYIPEGIKKDSPLVFMLHGYAGNSKSFMDSIDMNNSAEKHGYAVVYPQGIRDKDDKTGGAYWNSGLTDSKNDDTGFLVALAKYLQQTYGFNNKETFAAGLSNGAFMMYKLAVEAPQTFRAVASVAGTMSGGAWDERKSSASVGILQINGTKDGAVSVDGSMSASGGYGDSPAVGGIIEYWKNANGLSDLKVVKLSDIATAYEYSSKTNDNIVWYIEIEGGGHSWPTEGTAGFNTEDIILEFFSHYVE